ncbi:hypothetical protein AgCh_023182 [Apium graveolens]
MRNKASTDVSKASTDNIHQRMSASMDKASTANASTYKASTDKASTDKASTDESFNGCYYFGLSEDQVPIILVQPSDNQKYLKRNMEAEQIAPWLKDYMVVGKEQREETKPQIDCFRTVEDHKVVNDFIEVEHIDFIIPEYLPTLPSLACLSIFRVLCTSTVFLKNMKFILLV